MKKNCFWQKVKICTRQKIFLSAAVLGSLIALVYILNHNPYSEIQKDILKSAAKIHSYYRDRPGYWQLSTNTAKEDGLIKKRLMRHIEYDVQVGQGLDGENSLPSDLNFNIVLKHLNKSACISLSEMPIAEELQLILQQITIINAAHNVEFTWGGNPSLPVQKYTARQICESSENIIVWTFQ